MNDGISKYMRNMWNILDIMRDSLYIFTILLRSAAYIQQYSEIERDEQVKYLFCNYKLSFFVFYKKSYKMYR